METVVVGLDGSASANTALQWAVRHASPGDVVRAVYIWQSFRGAHREPLTGDELAAGRRHADHLVHEIVDEATKNIDTSTVSVQIASYHGHPGKWLVELSNEADLLVVGSRGKGGFVGLLLGSVSTYVTHHANCPVVVVRPPAEGDDAGTDNG